MPQLWYCNILKIARGTTLSTVAFAAILLCTACDLLPQRTAGDTGDEASATPDVVEVVNVTGISRLRDVGEPIDGRYLVQLMKFTRDEPVEDVLQRLNERYNVEADMVFRNVFYGFAASMTQEQAEAVAADGDVVYVEQDSYFSVAETDAVNGKSEGVPWGLNQLAGESGRYAPAYNGTGVNIYILSTGVNAQNKEIQTRVGRGVNVGYASPWLAGLLGESQPGLLMRLLGRETQVAKPESTGDCHGHGTRMATIAAGSSLGAAPMANIRPVKVLGCDGKGAASGVLQALEWLYSRYQRPAVMLMPFSGGKSKVVDAGVRNLLHKDVLTIAAAGDSGKDACEVSPAGVRPLLTVGGYSEFGSLSKQTNTGSCVDLILPGTSIDSSNHKNIRQLTSGSSAAAAYTAGIAAQFRETHGREAKLTVLRRLNEQVASVVLDIEGKPTAVNTLLVPLR